mmetsp:Transcript_69583/g.163419  ORF Transcript_69583/g.163419 Transcript_69583/m.163419 type:complete len:293 (+) Transcript_69583:2-880(+)
MYGAQIAVTLRLRDPDSFAMALAHWLCSLFLILGHSARSHLPKVKVACVGDSLTAGFPFDSPRGNDSSVSGYPWHLKQLLRETMNGVYDIRNFGKGETTIVTSSKSVWSPWYNETLQEAYAFEPDRVFLMFGANDVKENRLDKFGTEFEKLFSSLVASFQDLGSRPEVFVMIPPPMYDDNLYAGRAGGMNKKVYNEQLPGKLRSIAERRGVHVVDVHTCFLKHESCHDVTQNCCDWDTQKPPWRYGVHTSEEIEEDPCLSHDDAIHPNDAGYKSIALIVKRALLGELEMCEA